MESPQTSVGWKVSGASLGALSETPLRRLACGGSVTSQPDLAIFVFLLATPRRVLSCAEAVERLYQMMCRIFMCRTRARACVRPWHGFVPTRPISSKIGGLRGNLGKMRAKLGRIHPKRADFVLNLPELDPCPAEPFPTWGRLPSKSPVAKPGKATPIPTNLVTL